MRRLYLLVLFLVFSAFSVSALGISPAIKNIDFVSNQEVEINFYVLDSVADQTYDISLSAGDFVNYSTLSSTSVKGNGNVILKIKFPEKIEKPGEHVLIVSVKERVSEESFIRTVVEVGSTIKIFVPYPGIYGDLVLNIPDGNVNENIPVELHVNNRGDNILDITKVYVDFMSNDGNNIKRIDFTPVTIPVLGERYFRKYLDTTGMEPGNYIGSAKVFYSGVSNEVNKSFKIGSLYVRINNFTDYLVSGGIRKFYVTLENRWNSPISSVYVDVNLTNELNGIVFRTPFIDLEPWEEKTIESFFDTDDLELGSYDMALNASYNGKNTLAYGKLLIANDYSLIIYGSSAIISVIFFIILYFVLRRFFKRKRIK